MAPRKDMMRVLRQDTEFSAKLGFGASSSRHPEPSAGGAISGRSADGPPKRIPSDSADAPLSKPDPCTSGSDEGHFAAPQKGGTHLAAPAQAGRSHVIYVAVSLTAVQAARAEAWAKAAKCTVPFLMRRVAQELRGPLFDDWNRNGMPEIAETRGRRGRFPTSVTLTLTREFARAMTARHDPYRVIGLGRIIGPAFRARFQIAFDEALTRAEREIGSKGAAGDDQDYG